MSGIIFDVQSYSVHDGPGIRTLVFMKGCPLRCKWCCNPEGQEQAPEIRFLATRCVGRDGCRMPCAKACPAGAIAESAEGKPITDRGLCNGCGRCAEACLYGARQLSGRNMDAEELLAVVLKDEPFLGGSGGGVTVGGGEPMTQPEFVTELLQRCRQNGLHTAIETCGHVPWEQLQAVLEQADLVYYDIKHMDTGRHEELTGAPNGLILENAARVLSASGAQVIVRVPIVPGYNDTAENIRATARFVAVSGGRMMGLLPYHPMGTCKYGQLDRECPLKDVQAPAESHMQELRAIVKSEGISEVSDSTR